MPSDPRTQPALSVVAGSRARFRSALENARDQMRTYIATHRGDSDDLAANTTRELGAFASGRIDTNRFANMFAAKGNVGLEVIARAERCMAVLDDLLLRGDELFTTDVPRGANSGNAVASAFASAGRAFGAVLAFQAAKTGAYRDEQHGALLESFAFSRWNRSERLIAPPIVIEIDGEDFIAEELAGFIDGNVRIIAVLRGASSSAPLARLITPGVLVIQSVTPDALAEVDRYEGPAIAALVPEGAATFVHDPRGGSSLKDRLRIDNIPESPPRSIGSRSVWQQRDELAHLSMLSRLAAEANAQVDTLANWLLKAGGLGTPHPEGAER
ncbi:MAG TPA: hypothetical protein VFD22_15330 [Gemmatimonadaceae bacterium]|nr:hypothetical protein [Gemmatimonadaceae bacterium]